MPKTRILIVSESPVAPTGMAEVLRLVFGTLLDEFPTCYELHQIAVFHGQAVIKPRWPLYPTRRITGKKGIRLFLIADANGELTFPEVVSRVRPDIVFGFNDVGRLLHLCTPAAQRNYKLVIYANLAGFPFFLPGGNALNLADMVITMSEFSSRVALASVPALEPAKVTYMYSPADVVRFRPVETTTKESLREVLLPEWMPKNGFILGWVGRNQWRKQVWLCYAMIHYLRNGDYLICSACNRVTLMGGGLQSCWGVVTVPGPVTGPVGERSCRHCRSKAVDQATPLPDIFLWLHMPTEPGKEDWPKSYLETLYDARPGRDVHYTEEDHGSQFMQPADMALLYQSWDCLLYLSGGEGFGLPAWEAMSCGIPIIYTNYSAHGEYIGKARAGLPVAGTLQPEPGTCILRMVGDVSQSIEAVRKMYFDAALRTALGANGRAFCDLFQPKIVAQRWHKVFQEVAAGHRP